MTKLLSFERYRFPPNVIRHAIWLYFRFTLSLRDVEELMAQRGIVVSREAIRCWVNKFGPLIAANLRRRRSHPSSRWHLDEMVCRIGGRRMYPWRAVDDECEVLDVLVQKRRNKPAALKLLRRLLKNQGIHPEATVTDKLASYRAAAKSLGLTARHQPGGMRENNRVENSHLSIRRRERKQQKFKTQGSAQRFLSTHAVVYNTYNLQKHLISRPGLRRLRAQPDAAWAAPRSSVPDLPRPQQNSRSSWSRSKTAAGSGSISPPTPRRRSTPPLGTPRCQRRHGPTSPSESRLSIGPRTASTR